MSKVYHFCFKRGQKQVISMTCDFAEARRTGNELADEGGSIKLLAYNEPLMRWDMLGTFHGGMKMTNAFGDKCIIKPDFSGLEHVERRCQA